MIVPLVLPRRLSPDGAVSYLDRRPCLPAVLTRLGHVCSGTCRTAAAELGAQVWFSRRESTRGAALLVIDTEAYVGSVVRSHHVLRLINDCTKADGIRVVVRRPGDAGRALALLTPRAGVVIPAHHAGSCSGCSEPDIDTRAQPRALPKSRPVP